MLSELLHMSRRELAALLAAGHPIDRDDLADREYRGISLGLPRLVEALTWKTFRKAFHRDRARLRGWNVRLEQRGIDARSRPMMRAGVPLTFGHFEVSAPPASAPAPCLRGLLLDYGAFAHPADPLGRLRDPLVALRPGDPTLLLGCSYLAIAGRWLPTPTFFCLEREGPLQHVPRLPA